MARTINTKIIGPVVLDQADNPLTITTTGAVISTAPGADGVDGGASTRWIIKNDGTVASSYGDGVSLAGTGSITNAGSISGATYGVSLGDGGYLTNTNSISGGADAIAIQGAAGRVVNKGSISVGATGSAGIALKAGGSVTNAATGTVEGGTSDPDGWGVQVTGGSGRVANSGVISASNGVYLGDGGKVTNNASGVISGTYLGRFGIQVTGARGVVTNYGKISSGGFMGVALDAGGRVTNHVGASITGYKSGVYVAGGSATITNAGTISSGFDGIVLSDGGSVTNDAGGYIAGSFLVGVNISGGPGTITNAGTIHGGYTVVRNDAVYMSPNPANRVVVDPGAVFVGALDGGTGTLELARGDGSIGGISNGSFDNFDSLVVDRGATWTLNEANTVPSVTDNGTVDVATSLDVSTAIDRTSIGLFQLDHGANFEVAAALGTHTRISFLTGSELVIDNAGSFGTKVGTPCYAGPQLQDFASGDTIDLKNFSLAGATIDFTHSTGLLQISNSAHQVATLDFQTSSLGGGHFQIAGDGATGIFIAIRG